MLSGTIRNTKKNNTTRDLVLHHLMGQKSSTLSHMQRGAHSGRMKRTAMFLHPPNPLSKTLGKRGRGHRSERRYPLPAKKAKLDSESDDDDGDSEDDLDWQEQKPLRAKCILPEGLSVPEFIDVSEGSTHDYVEEFLKTNFNQKYADNTPKFDFIKVGEKWEVQRQYKQTNLSNIAEVPECYDAEVNFDGDILKCLETTFAGEYPNGVSKFRIRQHAETGRYCVKQQCSCGNIEGGVNYMSFQALLNWMQILNWNSI